MAKRSAGLLMYRRRYGRPEVFLVHPGGPFWSKKDLGAWTIPKGEIGPEEEPLAAAKREFEEETGFPVPDGVKFVPLKPLKQPSGKVIEAWAFEGDCDAERLRSNLFQMEWPLRSGRKIEVPEADRGAWFSVEEALEKIIKGQRGFIEELLDSQLWPGAYR